jgi:hypothetical protein
MPFINALKSGYADQTGVLSATPDASHGIDTQGFIVVLRPLLSATDTTKALVCSAIQNTLSASGGGIGVTMGGGVIKLATKYLRFCSVGQMERTDYTGAASTPRGMTR